MDLQVQPQVTIKLLKNLPAAILLSLFLGPVGVLYSSVISSIVLTILFMLAFSIKPGGGVLAAILWIISIYWSVLSVNKYNKKVLRYFGINFKKKPTT